MSRAAGLRRLADYVLGRTPTDPLIGTELPEHYEQELVSLIASGREPRTALQFIRYLQREEAAREGSR